MKLLTTVLLAPLLLATVESSPWIGTEYVAIVKSTIADGYTGSFLTEPPIVATATIPISPTAANPAVLSTFRLLIPTAQR